MDLDQVEANLLSLLEPDYYKTTDQLVQEFRMEYPALWEELEKEGRELYGKSCSSVQQPFTRILKTLLNLPDDCCMRIRKGNQYYWSKKEEAS